LIRTKLFYLSLCILEDPACSTALIPPCITQLCVGTYGANIYVYFLSGLPLLIRCWPKGSISNTERQRTIHIMTTGYFCMLYSEICTYQTCSSC
ncbi:hypothetical protein BDQ17DRAFT_1351257, partial [Cyathus striatus]